MAEILLCKHSYSLYSMDDIHDMYALQLKHKLRTGPPVLVPYRPYLHSDRPLGTDENIMLALEHGLPKKDITDMAFNLGEENTIAITEIAASLREYGATSAGAATSVYARRMQGFGNAVERYQEALLEYRAATKSGPAAASRARQKAIDAFQKMQKGFHSEINVVKSGIRRSKSLAVTRASRGLNIARNSRRVAKLRVFDEVQATRLVRFGKYGRYLGNGLAVIDFGSRVSHIHDSYTAGDDWCREMFIESSSFAASAISATAVAAAGSAIAEASLVALVAATPAGWVLIVAGIGVTAAAAVTSIWFDKTVKESAGGWYDSIMKWAITK